jgi:CheY-like chemotaxis protein
MFRVFVVDDERIAQNNISDALANHTNWQVLSVFSSSVGLLNKAKELKPDVIFLDIKMPGETGLSIAKQLIALPQAPLIVFVTALNNTITPI